MRNMAYPLMKEAALFCLDWLIVNKEGYLVASPATSPEQSFKIGDNRLASVSEATTMDMSLITELFDNCILSAEALKMDKDFAGTLQAARARLLPLQIGAQGQLQEWSLDFEGEDVHHRLQVNESGTATQWSKSASDGIVTFPTKAGEKYILTPLRQ